MARFPEMRPSPVSRPITKASPMEATVTLKVMSAPEGTTFRMAR